MSGSLLIIVVTSLSLVTNGFNINFVIKTLFSRKEFFKQRVWYCNFESLECRTVRTPSKRSLNIYPSLIESEKGSWHSVYFSNAALHYRSVCLWYSLLYYVFLLLYSLQRNANVLNISNSTNTKPLTVFDLQFRNIDRLKLYTV